PRTRGWRDGMVLGRPPPWQLPRARIDPEEVHRRPPEHARSPGGMVQSDGAHQVLTSVARLRRRVIIRDTPALTPASRLGGLVPVRTLPALDPPSASRRTICGRALEGCSSCPRQPDACPHACP